MTYTTIQHPVSGESFAAEVDASGVIIRAAGPLYYRDEEAMIAAQEAGADGDIQDYLDNQERDESEADALWLTEAIARMDLAHC